MGGGLLQLVVVGQQDAFLSENPEISFYKYVYKKHTKFSMESINLSFETNPVLSPNISSGGFLCKVGRYGDLLSDLYFCITLPEIYSSDTYKFRWIENVGNLLIKKATVSVNGTIIDTITGEWLNVWNELSLYDTENINRMIGNEPYIIAPVLNQPKISITNNKFSYTFYPSSTKSDEIPSIPSKKLYIPLKFWFNKKSSLALPLLRLQYEDIYINIELETSENLYQVYSTELDEYISPIFYNELYGDNINIHSFTNTFSLTPYIEANFIFLDNNERNTILLKPSLSYLVEQLDINLNNRVLSTSDSSTLINLNIHKPTKEIIWTAHRDDVYKFNNHNNYTASIPENREKGILEKCSIIWNRTNNRIEEKPGEYYNLIQPYQHHSKVPRQGIYCYSFALEPEKEYPTGYYNASVINTSLLISVNGNHNNNKINTILTNMNKPNYVFDYIINVYSISYNIFEIISGSSGLKFA